MRIKVEANPEEFQNGHRFLEGMAGAVRPYNPDLADRLEKAAHDDEPARPSMDHRALQDDVEDLRAQYLVMLHALQKDISDVLDEATKDGAA